MAKDAALKDVSKTELAEAYSKLKTRTKNAQMQAKREGEALVEDVLTIASAGLLGNQMGVRRATAHEEAIKSGLQEGTEKYNDAVAEGGHLVGGIDMDLFIGGAATAIGMMKLGGNMSNTVRKVGIGGLAAYAARIGYEKGEESVEEESREG